MNPNPDSSSGALPEIRNYQTFGQQRRLLLFLRQQRSSGPQQWRCPSLLSPTLQQREQAVAVRGCDNANEFATLQQQQHQIAPKSLKMLSLCFLLFLKKRLPYPVKRLDNLDGGGAGSDAPGGGSDLEIGGLRTKGRADELEESSCHLLRRRSTNTINYTTLAFEFLPLCRRLGLSNLGEIQFGRDRQGSRLQLKDELYRK
nr:hypothetical protein Iba_chr06bCG10210 [Ipomoea batatas]